MVRPYRFSLEEFLKLPLPERGVELLEGEIYQMAPIGPRHAYAVNRWNRVFSSLPEVFVQVQGPLALPPDTYLEPDLALLRPGDYRERLPRPEDVLLVPEVWVQDLLGGKLLLFRTPEEDHYREQIWVRPGERVSPLAFPEAFLEVPW